MNEQEFLKGQRVITPDGHGEVTDAISDKVTVKLDSGTNKVYQADDLQDDSIAG